MADIFGKNVQYGRTTISVSEEMTLILPGSPDTIGFLVQGVTIQYGQAINRIYEIGSHYTYFAPGRSAGSCQINRIVGNADLATMLGGAGTGMFNANPDQTNKQIILKDNKNGIVYKLSGCVVETYSTSTDANGVLVQEGVAVQFASMEILGGRRTAQPIAQPVTTVGA